MATVVAVIYGLDLDAIYFSSSYTVVSASSSFIQLRHDSGIESYYYGSFSYSPYSFSGLSGGYMTAFEEYNNGVFLGGGYGIYCTVSTYFYYADRNDAAGLVSYILSGDDYIYGAAGYADDLRGYAGNDIVISDFNT